MAMNCRCIRTGCKKKHLVSVIKQLSPGHQRAFPAILTHKSGISKDLSNIMRPLFQHSVGPHRLSKIIRNLRTQHFDELQSVNYNGINNFKLEVASQLLNRTSPQFFDQFSDFFDKMKYNGYTSSSNYLSCVYSSLVSEYRLFIDQHTSQLDGIILKLDHSFKIIKHMGKVNDVSTFNGLFTVLNKYGEIRMQLLVPSKGHNCLRPSFNNMMDIYRKYNLGMPQGAYTDNVMGDRKFLEVIPSLTENVLHVTPSQAELLVRNNPYTRFPVVTIPADISVTIFDTKEGINAACGSILEIVRGQNSQLCVGFDIEWTPPFVRITGLPIPVALVQIYFGTSIYLFRTFSFDATTFPEKLREVILDIGTLCYDKEMTTRRNYSLQRICGEVLKLNLLKPTGVRKSNWEMDSLSPEHIQYAAVDAFNSLEVYKKLKDLITVKEPVIMHTPTGTFVALYASSADRAFPAALGYLRDMLSRESSVARSQELRYPGSRYLIGMEVVKVLIPGILLDRYKNGLSLDDFAQPKFIISAIPTLLEGA
ncbi:ribonuclease H-like domain-containing protein [Thamnidium elegans]|nr:ribonuclease H-like domain-containing protein [Thamnidium elegans]